MQDTRNASGHLIAIAPPEPAVIRKRGRAAAVMLAREELDRLQRLDGDLPRLSTEITNALKEVAA